MEKRDRKWLKPLVIYAMILAVIDPAYKALMSYLASRSVVLTAGDILTTLSTLSTYLAVLGIILTAAVIVNIAVFKMKKPLESIIR